MAKTAKIKTKFVCQNCGTESLRWQGKCNDCGNWNSFVEEKVAERKGISLSVTSAKPVQLDTVTHDVLPRVHTLSPELDRVLGGGIVVGSVVLVGGDPGIGKSTLLLQEAAGLASEDFKVLYISGEESAQQIKMRADRLGLSEQKLFLLADTHLETALSVIDNIQPNFVIIDSVQTIYSEKLDSAAGSVSQLRECTLQLVNLAKKKNIPIFLIGHVTKDGYLAGPKVIEHMVDALLVFEGDRDHYYRILRSMKNRFGSTREIGVFEMRDKGLVDVTNPSSIFLSDQEQVHSGSTVVCCLEGSRPILLEVQTLVSHSNYGMPQRATTGIDAKRVTMLLAIAEKKLDYKVGTKDVFVNVVGGYKIDEPSTDLGVLLGIASSLENKSIQPNTILMGEVGLGGEIRPVSHIETRLSEAFKLGFEKAIIPYGNIKTLSDYDKNMVFPVKTVNQALQVAFE